MHEYVAVVFDRLRSLGDERVGCGGYLRIKPGADPERVRIYLTEERDAAQAAVTTSQMPSRLRDVSVPMQMLILTELLLAKPDEPVNPRAITTAQGYSTGYVSERVEEAAGGLVMMAPELLEVVGTL